jgi:hypothetical protein
MRGFDPVATAPKGLGFVEVAAEGRQNAGLVGPAFLSVNSAV